MIKIKTFAFNFLAVNSFIIYDDTKEAIIIDPAVSNMEEFNSIVEFVKKLTASFSSITEVLILFSECFQ